MRYQADHKDFTRTRILDAASKRFRSEGIASVGVQTLMKDAGLTHGGFYVHFSSKEDLATEAMLTALEGTYARLVDARNSSLGGLEGILREYMGVDHINDPSTACAYSLLAPEMSRRPLKGRRAFAKELQRFIDLVAATLPAALTPEIRVERATAIFGLMMGTVQMARIATDAKSASAILASGIQAALMLASA